MISNNTSNFSLVSFFWLHRLSRVPQPTSRLGKVMASNHRTHWNDKWYQIILVISHWFHFFGCTGCHGSLNQPVDWGRWRTALKNVTWPRQLWGRELDDETSKKLQEYERHRFQGSWWCHDEWQKSGGKSQTGWLFGTKSSPDVRVIGY